MSDPRSPASHPSVQRIPPPPAQSRFPGRRRVPPAGAKSAGVETRVAGDLLACTFNFDIAEDQIAAAITVHDERDGITAIESHGAKE